jgi:hypothetical protein
MYFIIGDPLEPSDPAAARPRSRAVSMEMADVPNLQLRRVSVAKDTKKIE